MYVCMYLFIYLFIYFKKLIKKRGFLNMMPLLSHNNRKRVPHELEV